MFIHFFVFRNYALIFNNTQGLSSSLHDAGFFVNYPWTSLINILDSKPILKLSVHDYLWGYEDKLIRFASGIVPNFIDFIKFGLLDRVSNLIN